MDAFCQPWATYSDRKRPNPNREQRAIWTQMTFRHCCNNVKCKGLSAEIDPMALRAFRHLVEERAGLAVAAEREGDLVAAVRAGICETNSADAKAFFGKLDSGGDRASLLSDLAARMLPQETYFLRDRNQLELLRREVLAPLRQTLRPGQAARLWSAGCSTGEEAWSLAFLAHEELSPAGISFEVIGTDLQPESLLRATTAIYREWSFRGLSMADRERWFELKGEGWAVRPEFRGKVQFYCHDLQSPAAEGWAQPGFDLVVCRNVFIYYQPSVVRATMDRLAAALRPDGALVVGHNEAGGHLPVGMQVQVHAESALFRNGATSAGRMRQTPVPAQPQYQRSTPLPFSPATPPGFAPLPGLAPQVGFGTPPTSAAAANYSPATRPSSPLVRAAAPGELAEYRKQSARLLEAGDALGAKIQANRGLALRPGDPHLLLVAAQAEANLGRLASAEALVELGLTQHPTSADFHFLRYLLLVERGDGKSALAILEKLRYLAPGFAAAHVHRARMLEDVGAPERAAEAWQQARQALLVVDPQAAVPWFESVKAIDLLAEVDAVCQKLGLASHRDRESR